MFTQISWSNYITIVFISLTGYYLFVALKYYRTDLQQLLTGKKQRQEEAVTKPKELLHRDNMQQAFEKQEHFQLSQSLADEIQAYLNEAGRNEVNKKEVMASLRSLLNKYAALKDSSFKEFIQNLIETECAANCSIHFCEAELTGLWN